MKDNDDMPDEPVTRLFSIASDIQSVARELRDKRKRIAFLERVLAQAVLTHGGKLPIDPSKSTEAVLALGSLTLTFGNGSVLLEEI